MTGSEIRACLEDKLTDTKKKPVLTSAFTEVLKGPSFTRLLASNTRVYPVLDLVQVTSPVAAPSIKNNNWTYHKLQLYKPTENDSIYFNNLSGSRDYLYWFQE